VSHVFGSDDATLTSFFHLPAAKPEERHERMLRPKIGDELRTVVIAARFPGGEKDARIG
jgi:hypothetical protein